MIKLHVISSNIRFENPEDGQHNWPYRAPMLVKLIESHNPDILGTQEGRQPQLLDLNNRLSNLNLVDTHRNYIEERMYPCIYVSKNIKIIDSGDIWLSETPDVAGSKSFDSMFPRLCTWIYAEKEMRRFYYFNLHLDHLEDETRKKQAEVLVSEICKINIDENIPIIIGGDFNQCANEPLQAKMINELKNFYDPYAKLNKPHISTYHRFKGDNPDGCRIDWFLINQSCKLINSSILSTSFDGQYASDHHPVDCIIEI